VNDAALGRLGGGGSATTVGKGVAATPVPESATRGVVAAVAGKWGAAAGQAAARALGWSGGERLGGQAGEAGGAHARSSSSALSSEASTLPTTSGSGSGVEGGGGKWWQALGPGDGPAASGGASLPGQATPPRARSPSQGAPASPRTPPPGSPLGSRSGRRGGGGAAVAAGGMQGGVWSTSPAGGGGWGAAECPPDLASEIDGAVGMLFGGWGGDEGGGACDRASASATPALTWTPCPIVAVETDGVSGAEVAIERMVGVQRRLRAAIAATAAGLGRFGGGHGGPPLSAGSPAADSARTPPRTPPRAPPPGFRGATSAGAPAGPSSSSCSSSPTRAAQPHPLASASLAGSQAGFVDLAALLPVDVGGLPFALPARFLAAPAVSTMTIEEISREKHDLKVALKGVDRGFLQRRGRKATKAEKEGLRRWYVRYWRLKGALGGGAGGTPGDPIGGL